ncbi:MAG: NAD(P)/FAD-dependent oxidoreductase [Gammaproteobacteria bacterium]|nr:NAD(P)/FAD-dependent oxidoreductase [Gammaproteobacteria bacterium]NIR83002.1 NAD(P)/FAD-dependent oxidoreductase [Gammaproteobacteria bacterium]NIR90657.1 NAD(P)/FAD-dependent oxidoreductase [Gammaproteobacteria bacterium]NIU04159.1 NAD(P)/FAD-dependent oxidoreductase [Gammaproteobacteria bacterium]NIV51450.1 FAD-dependent oxidoreductase [Gammaproteobacteria bacterium]
MRTHDAIIVGGGPAGLSAAHALHRAGVTDIVVLERESEAGGVPRHCHHPGFGFSQYYWPHRGPAYARRLRRGAAQTSIRTNASVVALEPGGVLTVATPEGLEDLTGRAVLLATGVRETPRSARLVSGERPWGVLTTGALQQFLHLAGVRPCRRAVIVGTEWVSFSALLTLRRAGIQSVAMIEAGARITAPRPGDWVSRWMFGTPVLTGTRVVRVLGREVVEGVEVERDGTRWVLPCDAVVFTGGFVPEVALVREGHLELDPGTAGPVIDQYWRCSDPAYFAAGNVVRPVETSGVVGREGAAAGRAMAAALGGAVSAPERRVRLRVHGPLRYVYPQCIALPGESPGGLMPRARASRAANGTLRLVCNDVEVWRRRVSTLPERRIRLPGHRIRTAGLQSVDVYLEEPAPQRRSSENGVQAPLSKRPSAPPSSRRERPDRAGARW